MPTYIHLTEYKSCDKKEAEKIYILLMGNENGL